MIRNPRQRWRCAVRITAALATHFHERQQLTLPERWFQQARELTARHELARRRGWTAAGSSIRRQLLLRVQWQQTELRQLQQQLERLQQPAPPLSVSEVYRELLALEQEFERVEIEPRGSRILLTTERIVLQELDLGPFELVWNWSELGAEKELQVVALEPCRPHDGNDVTHPHVQDNLLCEGEASVPLEQALRSGRLYDYFAILQQTLKTYNPSSPYVHLEEWFSRRCESCSDSMEECDACDCHDCGEILCSECIAVCTGCQRAICRSCLDACPDCRRDFCQGCQPEGGFRQGVLCESCQETKEEDDAETVADDEEPDAAGTPLHPVCLGEVGVPA